MKLFFYYFIFFFSLSLNTFATEQFIHYTLHYPPYWYKANSVITGLHANLVRRIYKESNLNVKIIEVPYARISNLKINSEVAIVAYGSDPKTNHKFLYPLPMTKIQLKIYSLKNNPPKKLKDLIGKKIAIKNGFPLGNYQSIVENKNFKVTKTNTVLQGIKMLLNKRVNYLITLDDPYNKEIQEINMNKKMIYSSLLMNLKGWPIAVVKDHPKAKLIYKKVHQAYLNLKEQGVIIYKDEKLLLTNEQ